MGRAWTGIIMRHSEFLTLEYELSVSAAPVVRLPGARTIPPERPDLNDLVGCEMCRKGTLMDEAECGANDTTPRYRLMNALAPETGMFNGFAIERRPAAPARQPASKIFKWLFLKEQLRGMVDRKLNKMSAFGDLVERMSNGLRDSTPFICESSWIWVSAVIRESLSWGRAGLTKLMSACDYTSRHTRALAEPRTSCVKLKKLGPNRGSEMSRRC